MHANISLLKYSDKGVIFVFVDATAFLALSVPVRYNFKKKWVNFFAARVALEVLLVPQSVASNESKSQSTHQHQSVEIL